MLMREKIRKVVKDAAGKLGETGDFKFDVSYPDFKFGDYATNAALVLSKQLKSRRVASRILDSQIRESGQKPQDLAKALIEKMDQSLFEKVEIAGPGFINFKLKDGYLLNSQLSTLNPRARSCSSTSSRTSPSRCILVIYAPRSLGMH